MVLFCSTRSYAMTLRQVLVMGTAYADTSCAACLPGTFSEGKGNSECTPCPANSFVTHDKVHTYSTKNNCHFIVNVGILKLILLMLQADKCGPCLPDEYSFAGAAICTPREPCKLLLLISQQLYRFVMHELF